MQLHRTHARLGPVQVLQDLLCDLYKTHARLMEDTLMQDLYRTHSRRMQDASKTDARLMEDGCKTSSLNAYNSVMQATVALQPSTETPYPNSDLRADDLFLLVLLPLVLRTDLLPPAYRLDFLADRRLRDFFDLL